MNSFVLLLLVLCIFVEAVHAAYCSGSPAPGERVNSFPIFDDKLRFVRSVKNAMLFEAGPANASFPIVHLWGTPYEVGFAQGTIRKNEIKEFIDKTWAYLNSALVLELYGDRLPQWAKVIIVNQGMAAALDWSRKVTEPYTTQAYLDEMRGMADATGMDYDLLYRINMFPELTKAQCSFFGAWGSAVA